MLAALTLSQAPKASEPSPPPERFADLAAACAPEIHIRTLAALVRHESALNPYAININGQKQLEKQPTSAAEAAAVAQRLLDRGVNIDVGLGQINSNNFSVLHVALKDLFDSCVNLHAAARVLSDCYRRGVAVFGEGQAALHAALSCYNTGSLRNGINNGYVRKVAAQVTLPVPELLPLAGGPGTAPPSAPQTERAEDKPAAPIDETKRAGEPDAFAAASDADAFGQRPQAKQGKKNTSKLAF